MTRNRKRWRYWLFCGGALGVIIFFGGGAFPIKAGNQEEGLPKEEIKLVKPRAAIIIDDVGYLKQPAEELLQVPARLTFAVLPFTPYAKEFALAAHQKGFAVMLHLPMPLRKAGKNTGPGMIAKNWPETRIIQQLDADLAAVPGLVGVNNHMGTAGSGDKAYMTAILKELKRRNLFYIDSLTGCSVAEQCAREEQTLFGKRDVFIDHFRDLADNESSLRELIQIALKKGSAIGIGHAREGTAAEIKEMLPEFQKAGVTIVSVAQLVR